MVGVLTPFIPLHPLTYKGRGEFFNSELSILKDPETLYKGREAFYMTMGVVCPSLTAAGKEISKFGVPVVHQEKVRII